METAKLTQAPRDREIIVRALLATVSLFIPVIPFTLVFGVVVADSGLPATLGWSSSPIIFSGAAQITLLSLLGEGASTAAAATAALIVGARHMLYSAAVAPQFQHQPRWFRWLAPYVLIDQVFALLKLHHYTDPRAYRLFYLAAGSGFWLLWMLFTALGLILGPTVPESWGLAFAAPVMFVSLLVGMVDSRPKLVAAIVGAVLMALLLGVPNRGGLMIAALLGMAAGAVMERWQR